MWEPSLSRTPSAPVFAARSEPARSTKFYKKGQWLKIWKFTQKLFIFQQKERKYTCDVGEWLNAHTQ